MYFQTKNILKSNCYGNAKNYLNHQKKKMLDPILNSVLLLLLLLLL